MKKTKISLSIALTAIGLALSSTASAEGYLFVMKIDAIKSNKTMEEAITDIKNPENSGEENAVLSLTYNISIDPNGNFKIYGTVTKAEEVYLDFDSHILTDYAVAYATDDEYLYSSNVSAGTTIEEFISSVTYGTIGVSDDQGSLIIYNLRNYDGVYNGHDPANKGSLEYNITKNEQGIVIYGTAVNIESVFLDIPLDRPTTTVTNNTYEFIIDVPEEYTVEYYLSQMGYILIRGRDVNGNLISYDLKKER